MSAVKVTKLREVRFSLSTIFLAAVLGFPKRCVDYNEEANQPPVVYSSSKRVGDRLVSEPWGKRKSTETWIIEIALHVWVCLCSRECHAGTSGSQMLLFLQLLYCIRYKRKN